MRHRVARLLGVGAVVIAALAAVPATALAGKRVVPHGFYGVMWDGAATAAPEVEQEAQWDRMATAGVESVRTVFSWSDAQYDGPDHTDFTATDATVARAARHGIRLLPVVIWAPPWARLHPELTASPPARSSDYAAYLRALVQRYGGGGTFWAEHPELPRRPVRRWQIWNEMPLPNYWGYPRTPHPKRAWVKPYGRLVRAASRAVRGADRRGKIVLGALMNDSWTHLARLYRSGRIRGSFDVATMNIYVTHPKHLLRAASRVRSVLRRNGAGRLPLWITEYGAPAAEGRVDPHPWQRGLITTDAGMADRLRTAYRLFARHGRRPSLRVSALYWYTWASDYPERASTSEIFRYAGLLRYGGEQFEPTPALSAYEASARRHEGCVKTTSGACGSP